jgi:hypothetical protein
MNEDSWMRWVSGIREQETGLRATVPSLIRAICPQTAAGIIPLTGTITKLRLRRSHPAAKRDADDAEDTE